MQDPEATPANERSRRWAATMGGFIKGADADADAGLIAYEMIVLVKRLGQHMVANPRSPVGETGTG